ncbi:F-box/LRR-repeat protein 17 [Biomphalaria glabrata]|nr:F-box/LRR-repeat protein 17-like [Biomphalaria glabrata]KAI8745546.1 F-box/LRR-repeat protein 17 [Biomphalaria glabrata]
MNLHEFPNEILIHIFKYLTTQSKVNIALTCKKLKNVIYVKVLWQNVIAKLNLQHKSIKIKAGNKKFKSDQDEAWPDYLFKSLNERGINQVAIVSVNQSRLKVDMDLLSKYMPSLNVLIFKNMNLQSNSQFIQSIQQHSFLNMVSLDLSFNSFVNAAVIQSIVSSMHHLKYLYLIGNMAVNDDCLVLLLSLKQLQILNLCATKISDYGLAIISGYVLHSDKFIYDKSAPLLSKLQTLNIDLCFKVTCNSWPFLQSLPSLKTLITSSDNLVSSSAIESLVHMKTLRCLYIRGCMGNEVLQVLSEGDNKLQMLHLIDCKVNDIGVQYFSTGFRNLSFLSLNSYKITDSCVATICQHLPQLVLLDLAACCGITNCSLKYIGKCLEHLMFLCIDSCPKLTSNGLQYIPLNFQISCDMVNMLMTPHQKYISDSNSTGKIWLTKFSHSCDFFKILDGVLHKNNI